MDYILFYCDQDKIVHGIGRFKNGMMSVSNPLHIDYMKRHYDYDAKEEGISKNIDNLTLEDLEVGSGGHYYLDGDHVAHGEEAAKKYIAQYNGGE